MQTEIRHAVDVASAGVVVGTLIKLLPPIAALATIFWIGLNIYEKVTGNSISEMYQKWRSKK